MDRPHLIEKIAWDIPESSQDNYGEKKHDFIEADLSKIDSENKKAYQQGYELGLIEGLKNNKDVSAFSLDAFFRTILKQQGGKG